MNITYDRYSLQLNGRREFIRSGAMHYFRLPSQELWRDRLFKLKAAGYNAVDLYFCWGYHSDAPGQYDFTGIRDVRKLLQMTQELGLHVIARPGPYINAEYSGGGFPGWLLAKKHIPLRNRREGAFEWSDEYMGYVREWWQQIIPFINEAPNILMVQIENEYATLDVEPEYMQALYQMTREMGVKVPLFHNDLYVAGLYEDIVDIYAFDNYSVTQFETDWRKMPEVFQVLDNVETNLRPFCENRPLMAAELQAGWYGTWKGYKYEKITELLGREHIGISTKSLLGQGLTIFNHYKAIGGTNWNYTGSIETYTSYDFGAPISEAGLNTERLFESKAINYFLQSFDFSATKRIDTFPLSLSNTDCLYAIRQPIDHPDSAWLFLRNLTYEPHTLTIGERYPVTIKPFEVHILPYNIPLQSGDTLLFSTGEPLYQNPHLLVLKADRLVTATLQSTHLSATANLDDLVVTDTRSATLHYSLTAPGQLTFQCPDLPANEFRQFCVGKLRVLLLGTNLVDTFWVEEDGTMVAGPEMRLPTGYALANANTQWITINPDGSKIEHHTMPHAKPLDIPALQHWDIVDEAPELSSTHRHHASIRQDFQPISKDGADFDANALYEGSAWYRLPLNGPCPRHVEIDARHIWAAFLNGQFIGQGNHLVLIHGLDAAHAVTLELPQAHWKVDGDNELLIFVSGLGHPKGFHDDAQTPQGILSLMLDGQNVLEQLQIAHHLYSRRKPTKDSPPRLSEATLAQFTQTPIVRLKTTFSLPESAGNATPWGLKLQDVDYERIDLYLNGLLIGRYWRDCRRQEIFYLPLGILKTEPTAQNTVELILMNFKPLIDRTRLNLQPQHVTLQPYQVLTQTHPISQ